ncbi:MAG: phosphoglucosamine mutase [Myxococcales bacterium]|nr:phosphoglucosamine mutase [Myxococcales bacterium]
MVKRKWFGTDGIRGEANVAPMTPEHSIQVGQAIAVRLRRSGNLPRVIIGKDTRRSGYMFEAALAAGVLSAGADVLHVGVLPTPGIAFMVGALRADAGLVVSASHNPYYDNGIKVFGGDGFKLPDDEEAEIEVLMESAFRQQALASREALGRSYRIEDGLGRYVTYLKNVFPRTLSLNGVKMVVDCAHGAGYKVAPTVFRELGAGVIEVGTTPDGININKDCGALHPEKMAQLVVEHGANIGLALDGDGDRVILADENGAVVDGDHILAICAHHLKATGGLQTDTVVATVMSNLGLEVALKRRGITLVRTSVGDRYVVDEMRKGGHSLGGEQSGHVIFLDYGTTGDGVLCALKVLAAMMHDGRSLSDLARVMERFPQTIVNQTVANKRPLAELPEISRRIQMAEARLGEDSRVVVRYSGTEPLVRVMVEGVDVQLVKEMAHFVADGFV